jgi:hypothetical protein
LAIALFGLGACKEKAPAQPPPTTEKVTVPPAVSGVGIFVNETKVAELDRTKAATWPRLDSLLPAEARRYGMWQAIAGKAGGADFDIKKPGAAYGALVPALYPSKSGKGISLGLFDPVDLANKGEPKVGHEDLGELRVLIDTSSGRGQNDHGDGEATDPSAITLVIEAGGKTLELKGEKLLNIPRSNAPDDDSGEHKGWTVNAIFAAQQLPPPRRVLLTGESMNLTLEKEDLDEKTTIPFIKLNRQGQLRFRTYKKQGDVWAPMGGDLRGLQKIKVLQ